jgi:hypothetical protein
MPSQESMMGIKGELIELTGVTVFRCMRWTSTPL